MQAYITTSVSHDVEVEHDGNEIKGAPYLLIEKIWVPSNQRRMGIGSKLIAEAKLEAKKHGLNLKAAALPFDNGMELAELVEWYESHGFEVENADGHAVTMVY